LVQGGAVLLGLSFEVINVERNSVGDGLPKWSERLALPQDASTTEVETARLTKEVSSKFPPEFRRMFARDFPLGWPLEGFVSGIGERV
jgi:hypothetical protein